MNAVRGGVPKLYMGVADCIFWSRYVHAVKHHEIRRGHLFILSIFECCALIMRAFVFACGNFIFRGYQAVRNGKSRTAC